MDIKLTSKERTIMEVKREGHLQGTVSQVGRWNQPKPPGAS